MAAYQEWNERNADEAALHAADIVDCLRTPEVPFARLAGALAFSASKQSDSSVIWKAVLDVFTRQRRISGRLDDEKEAIDALSEAGLTDAQTERSTFLAKAMIDLRQVLNGGLYAQPLTLRGEPTMRDEVIVRLHGAFMSLRRLGKVFTRTLFQSHLEGLQLAVVCLAAQAYVADYHDPDRRFSEEMMGDPSVRLRSFKRLWEDALWKQLKSSSHVVNHDTDALVQEWRPHQPVASPPSQSAQDDDLEMLVKISLAIAPFAVDYITAENPIARARSVARIRRASRGGPLRYLWEEVFHQFTTFRDPWNRAFDYMISSAFSQRDERNRALKSSIREHLWYADPPHLRRNVNAGRYPFKYKNTRNVRVYVAGMFARIGGIPVHDPGKAALVQAVVLQAAIAVYWATIDDPAFLSDRKRWKTHRAYFASVLPTVWSQRRAELGLLDPTRDPAAEYVAQFKLPPSIQRPHYKHSDPPSRFLSRLHSAKVIPYTARQPESRWR